MLGDDDWRRRLAPDPYRVLRRHGTEPARSSALDTEKRRGTSHCAGCGVALLTSAMTFDSGTGWPSFHRALPCVFGYSRDFKLMWPRIEYHCARCGGHRGHLFDDAPPPPGKRCCNNGVALRFVADAA